MKEKKRIIVYIIFAILSVIYSINIAIRRSGTMFFVIWIFIAAILLLMAVGAKRDWWKKIPKCLRIAMCTLIVIGGIIFVGVEGLIISQINARGQADLDYVIVLGAQVKESGPSSILAARLKVAIDYLEDNPGTKVVVSGGQGSNEPFSEAEGMRRYLVENGIAEDRIIMESDSFNTVQNIRNSKALIGDDNAKIGIATSNFHVYRACHIAKKQGLKNVCGIAGNVIPLYMPQNMFREFFGVVKDFLAGNM